MLSICLGSFYGDCAKAMTVNNICKSYVKRGESAIVIRFSGGPQVGHNVDHNNIHHCFSNFGSGTLLNIPTYWSEFCLVDPFTAILERDVLKSKGVEPEIIYSPFCELITPFDVWYQWGNVQNREHGTVGVGIKSALDRIKHGYHLTISDAQNLLVLREKLKSIQTNYYKMSGVIKKFSFEKYVEGVYDYVSKVELKTPEQLMKENKYFHKVFEGSQGILLDQTHGVMPWCTPSNTTSKNAIELLRRMGYLDGNYLMPIDIYYVCRPYITRHGPGPLLTSTSVLEVEDENNTYNEYQKSFRSCEFDINLLKHSINIDKLYNSDLKNKVRRYITFSHGKELDEELEKKVKEEFEDFGFVKFEYEEIMEFVDVKEKR